MSNISGENNWF